MLDIRDLVNQIEATVQRHNLERVGVYGRWLWQNPARDRDLGPNEYGCADAANILYTIGRFPQEPVERAEWIATLQAFQDPVTGLFNEKTHYQFHTTAHCIAALELFDARPLYPLQEMARFGTKKELETFLEGLDWKERPWGESHKGAGLYAARLLAGEASAEWSEWYFAWLWENFDERTGLLRKGCVEVQGEGRDFSASRRHLPLFLQPGVRASSNPLSEPDGGYLSGHLPGKKFSQLRAADELCGNRLGLLPVTRAEAVGTPFCRESQGVCVNSPPNMSITCRSSIIRRTTDGMICTNYFGGKLRSRRTSNKRCRVS